MTIEPSRSSFFIKGMAAKMTGMASYNKRQPGRERNYDREPNSVMNVAKAYSQLSALRRDADATSAIPNKSQNIT